MKKRSFRIYLILTLLWTAATLSKRRKPLTSKGA